MISVSVVLSVLVLSVFVFRRAHRGGPERHRGGRRAVQALVDGRAGREPPRARVRMGPGRSTAPPPPRNAGLRRAQGAIVVSVMTTWRPSPSSSSACSPHYGARCGPRRLAPVIVNYPGRAGRCVCTTGLPRGPFRRRRQPLLVLASLIRGRARARADVHRRSHVVPPRHARRAAPRRGAPGGLRRRGYRPVAGRSSAAAAVSPSPPTHASCTTRRRGRRSGWRRRSSPPGRSCTTSRAQTPATRLASSGS